MLIVDLSVEVFASSLERLCEVEETLLAAPNQISEAEFKTTLRHLHTARGGAAMLGIDTLDNTIHELEVSIKRAEEASGVRGVATQSVFTQFGHLGFARACQSSHALLNLPTV